ncbi:MAG: glycosidase [Chloroflexi bacterium]|nr:glycosidase [Chloroflexota bacterium]
MEPDSSDPREVEGVLNPSACRGPDGELYLLPRLVAAGNYSCIGLARVHIDGLGDPIGVERMGVVLEPEAPYELNSLTGGGVEDPRVTYLASQQLYVMTYTALGEDGARLALAVSQDLVQWRRLGLACFAPYHGFDLGTLENKDGLLFPEPVQAPDGQLALALIHRPDFRDALPSLRERRPSMWISYAPVAELQAGGPLMFSQHHLLAAPEQSWERIKVGGGTPPVRVEGGWLVLYHGVSDSDPRAGLRYSAGFMLLDTCDPRRVLFRSEESILSPRIAAERMGTVPQVIFPEGIDLHADGTLDVYYGMADSRIGVARGNIADLLAPELARAA